MPGTYDGVGGRICARCGRPVQRTNSGELRCTPCRTDDRARELRAQRGREDAAQQRTAHVNTVRDKAAHPENYFDPELSEDELRILVEAEGPGAVDLGDPWDWALAERIGAVPDLPVADLLEADRLWSTGEARRVLKRSIGIGAYADSIGVTRRAVFNWAGGKSRPVGAHRNRAAYALLVEKSAAEHDDAILVAHGYEPSKAGMKLLERDTPHVEARQTDEPSKHCVGCAQYLRSQRRRY